MMSRVSIFWKGLRKVEGRGTEPLLPGTVFMLTMLIFQALPAAVNYYSQRTRLHFHLQKQL